MSKAIELIQRIQEIGYYGQHNDYSDKEYDRDTAEYHAPFKDLQLPDKDGPGLVAQTKQHKRKSRVEDGNGNKVK